MHNTNKNMDCLETIKREQRTEKITEKLINLLNLKFISRTVINVIRLNGVIDSGKKNLSLQSTEKYIDIAFKKSNPHAVILIINSPGGSPVQSELISSRIIALAKRKNIKVYSFVEDVAASGGYWLACAADEIYASNNSIIGSIGVIRSGFGFYKAIKNLGIERRVLTSGNSKSMLDPFEKEKSTDVRFFKKILHQVHQNFIQYVKSRRKSRLTQTDDFLFNGHFWLGENAVSFGLIDGIANMHDFIYEQFGENVKINYIEPKKSWIQNIFGVKKSINQEEFVDVVLNKLKHETIATKYNIK